MIGSNFVVSLIERAGNRLLRLDAESQARVARLKGKVLRLDIEEFPGPLFILPGETGMALRIEHDGAPHLVLRGRLETVLRMMARRDGFRPNAGEWEVNGDVALAQDFQALFRDLDIDWEELLAARIGDVAAHQAGRGVRHLRRVARDSLQTLGLDLAEYLKEESRLLVARPPMDEFLRAVDELRADVDRLAQRVARLQAGRR